MNCISTRGQASAVGFTEALLAGLAPDGGLYVPQSWPTVTAEEIAGFAQRPYAEVAAAILGRFAGDELTAEAITQMCLEAYGGFGHPAVTPLSQIGPGTFLLELFHGPTLAFKDLAMQLLARLYDHALAVRNCSATIVCATSGDTGGAAVEAFGGRGNIRLVALFPAGRISAAQQRFITTSGQANVRAVAVDGDFDDCQAILKALFDDEDFAHAVDLAAVNSINLARIIAQTTYYFVAAAALGSPERPMSFAVPTGNFGDAYAGYAAGAMGLPIERLVVATNANDIVARALNQGRYERRPAQATQSPAMDIQVASNFERLWFECSRRNPEETSAAFATFRAAGAVDIPPMTHKAMSKILCGTAVSEARATEVMAATLAQTGQFIDPHTAVALAGAQAIGLDGSRGPTIVLATAHPAKFPEAVRAATGRDPPNHPTVQRLEARVEDLDRLPAEAPAVKAYVRAFAS